MSMEELGKCIGVGKSAILKYEKGEVENLPRSAIEKMASVFGVTPSYLMCFDEWDKNAERLSDEVALIERIQAKFGRDMVTIIQNYCNLNDSGKNNLLMVSETLTELDRFKK